LKKEGAVVAPVRWSISRT